MKEILLLLAEEIIILGEFCWSLIVDDIFPYIPAGEGYRILVSVCLPKTKYYLAKKENINATLCIKGNGTRKHCVKIMIKNTTNPN